MQLTAEVKDDNYAELPRQQEYAYAKSTDNLLRADASTGNHYYDLNAAAKSYTGPWLFGRQHIQVSVRGMNAQWMQWCPVPADIRDNVQMRGNVIYQNTNGTYRTSSDVYEGVIQSEGGGEGSRYFVGKTQHTFFGNNLPGGRLQVVANIKIHLDERLPYNPMLPQSNQPAPQQNSQALASYTPASYGRGLAQPQGDTVNANFASANNYGQAQYGAQDNTPSGDSGF